MNTLIAIVSCWPRLHYTDAQRQTWFSSFAGDCKVFVGKPNPSQAPWFQLHSDDVQLDTEDDYFSLADKNYMLVRWALDHNYSSIFMVDDDTYVHGQKLEKALIDFQAYDYVGRKRPDVPYFSGAAYYLSQKSMEAISKCRLPSSILENTGQKTWRYNEAWLAAVMKKNEIEPHHDARILFTHPSEGKVLEEDKYAEDTIAEFEFSGIEMFTRHQQVTNQIVVPSLEWRVQDLEFQLVSKQKLQDKIQISF